MSNGDAIEALMQGPKVKVVQTVDLTIPEGLSIREVAPLVDEARRSRATTVAPRPARACCGGPAGSARRAARDTAEGFLFPATYTLVDGAPARNLVDAPARRVRGELRRRRPVATRSART